MTRQSFIGRLGVPLLVIALAMSGSPALTNGATVTSHTLVVKASKAECAQIVKLFPKYAGKPCVMHVTVSNTARVSASLISGPKHSFERYMTTEGPFGLWSVTVRFWGYFDGLTIRSTVPERCDYTALGVSISITSCSVLNNGGASYPYYADFGTQWKICSIPAFFCRTHGMREGINRRGSVIRIERW